jgi:DNA repair protein RadC
MTTSTRIKDMPDRERPRERLVEFGADGLRDAELIAILLRTGTKGTSAIAIAELLLHRFGSLGNLARASLDELRQTKGIGRDKAIALKSAFTLAQRMAKELGRESPLLDTPERIAELLRENNRLFEVEHFQIVLLNTRRKLIRVENVSRGTLDTILVHPREVFKLAIAANASASVRHKSAKISPILANLASKEPVIRSGTCSASPTASPTSA